MRHRVTTIGARMGCPTRGRMKALSMAIPKIAPTAQVIKNPSHIGRCQTIKQNHMKYAPMIKTAA
jgi:hypothetical protein